MVTGGAIRLIVMLHLDPDRPPPPIIERAYELARSGKFTGVREICEHLFAEGYRDLDLHFEGAGLRADLARACRRARDEDEPSNLPVKRPHSRSASANTRRFELKAAECRQLAESAQYGETRQIYIRLATSYERLAEHAESGRGVPTSSKQSG
jgi:hypothetical protein